MLTGIIIFFSLAFLAALVPSNATRTRRAAEELVRLERKRAKRALL
jgi:hypothetical protein